MKRSICLASAISTLVLLAITMSRAEDWPQFRGPTGQGISSETNLPLRWSATDNVAWKTPLPGESWAFKLGGRGDLHESNLVWMQKKGMPKVPSMLYVKPHLYAVNDAGIATCMNAATGKIVWQERLGGNYSASPVFASGRIYCISDEGETTVIAAGAEFKVLARNPLGETVQASPAVSQGHLFIRTEKNRFCIRK